MKDLLNNDGQIESYASVPGSGTRAKVPYLSSYIVFSVPSFEPWPQWGFLTIDSH